MTSLLPSLLLPRQPFPATPSPATAPAVRTVARPLAALFAWLSDPRRWLSAAPRPRVRPRRRPVDDERAALEACASEGAEIEFRTIELDGSRYGALYRHGELVCLLPEAM